jgi:hypothetical protein
MARQTVDVSAGLLAEQGAGAVQDAIDAVSASGGGTVRLPESTLVLSGPVRLRTGVRLAGRGPGTVLRKAPSVSSPIIDWLGYGHFEVTVEEPDLFGVGMGVTVRDANSFGFYETVGTVVGKDGNALFLDTALHHDYVPVQGARVVNVFPLVCSDSVRDVAVADLTIDGAGDPERLGGCRGGGIHLLRTHGAAVENVEVVHYNGDALSFQQCTDVIVRGCELHHNAGGGIHPGSGSVRYRLVANHVHDNGGDGIFYCLRTTHSDCESNAIHGNGGAGISIGERDTDHAIRGNDVRRNGGPGIAFRPVQYHGGDRVAIAENTLADNGGEAEVVIAPGIRDVTLSGNRFERDVGPAVAVGEGTEGVRLSGNVFNGEPLAPEGVRDSAACASWEEPSPASKVGARCASPDTTRHLGCRLPAALPPGFEDDGDCAGAG